MSSATIAVFQIYAEEKKNIMVRKTVLMKINC
jgi:hypothetical protein